MYYDFIDDIEVRIESQIIYFFTIFLFYLCGFYVLGLIYAALAITLWCEAEDVYDVEEEFPDVALYMEFISEGEWFSENRGYGMAIRALYEHIDDHAIFPELAEKNTPDIISFYKK